MNRFELLERFVAELGRSAADIRRGTDERGNPFVEVTPRNSRAARIRVLDEPANEYDLLLGENTLIHIPIPPPPLTGAAEDEFIAICRAVAKGNLTEKVAVLFGASLFSLGILNVGDRKLKSFSGIPIPWPWKNITYPGY